MEWLGVSASAGALPREQNALLLFWDGRGLDANAAVQRGSLPHVTRSARVPLEVRNQISRFGELVGGTTHGYRRDSGARKVIGTSALTDVRVDDVGGLLWRETRKLHGLRAQARGPQ